MCMCTRGGVELRNQVDLRFARGDTNAALETRAGAHCQLVAGGEPAQLPRTSLTAKLEWLETVAAKNFFFVAATTRLSLFAE